MDVTFIVEITSDCYLYLATYRVFNNLMTHGCTDWWTLPLIPIAHCEFERGIVLDDQYLALNQCLGIIELLHEIHQFRDQEKYLDCKLICQDILLLPFSPFSLLRKSFKNFLIL